jgi:hypothetical protein
MKQPRLSLLGRCLETTIKMVRPRETSRDKESILHQNKSMVAQYWTLRRSTDLWCHWIPKEKWVGMQDQEIIDISGRNFPIEKSKSATRQTTSTGVDQRKVLSQLKRLIDCSRPPKHPQN